MRSLIKLFCVVFFVTVAIAQSLEPPLKDTRLTIHTLVREDIFSGFLEDNLQRFTRGEKNIDWLLENRPKEKSSLLAWKGGATLYRAVRAYENKNQAEFQKLYHQSLDYFSQAKTGNDGGASAVTGGSFVVFADRLPKELRAAAWEEAYANFAVLWKQQAAIVDKLPVHIRGELLGGLAQSAARTGRAEELAMYLDKIETLMAGTPYAPIAKQWKANPKAAANGTITCLTCHEGGRLQARLTSLNAK
ncbi:MAG: hypothetical protein AB1757_26640 [Acidobacteriota bacterium]